MQMEKNYDGYYRMFTIWTGDYSSCYDKGISIKVENNKIIDCFLETTENQDNQLGNLNNHFGEIIGENIKDFAFDCVVNNKFMDKDFNSYNYTYDNTLDLLFQKSSEENFTMEKQKAFPTEDELKAHDQKVADILQAKENKNALGKTDTLSKIADMKNGRTGGK